MLEPPAPPPTPPSPNGLPTATAADPGHQEAAQPDPSPSSAAALASSAHAASEADEDGSASSTSSSHARAGPAPAAGRPLRRPRVKVVANLPYNITKEVLAILLPLGELVGSLHLMIQHEAGERLCETVPGGAEGWAPRGGPASLALTKKDGQTKPARACRGTPVG
jgi:hypothetical protein